MMRTVCDTTELEVEQNRLLTEMETVAEMVKRIVAEKGRTHGPGGMPETPQ